MITDSTQAIHKYDTATQAITLLAGSTANSWDAPRVDGSLSSARFAQLQRLSLDGRGGEWTASKL